MNAATRARLEQAVIARLREAPDGRPRPDQLTAALRHSLAEERVVVASSEMRQLERWLDDRLFGLRPRATSAR